MRVPRRRRLAAARQILPAQLVPPHPTAGANQCTQCRALVAVFPRVQADVRLLIDAEHSYFQPAIDNTVTELQRQVKHTVRGG